MAELTDLEITRLCAKSMNIAIVKDAWGEFWRMIEEPQTVAIARREGRYYNPLGDDAQCFALVKRFDLDIMVAEKYCQFRFSEISNFVGYGVQSKRDINHAICLCVARMELAKASV